MENGLADAVREIQNAAVKAQTPKFVELNRHIQLSSVDGKLALHDTPVPPKHFVTSDIPSLFELAEEFLPEQTLPDDASDESVGYVAFYNHTGVLVIFNVHGRLEETAKYEVQYSQEWGAINSNEGSRLTQKEFIEAMRKFSDRDGTAQVIASVREVEFGRTAQAKGTVKRGDESMGRSIEDKIANVDKIPEQFQVKVNAVLHDDFDQIALIFDVDIDAEHQTFSFKYQPNEHDRALRAIADEVRRIVVEQVAATGFPCRVVWGTIAIN